MIDTKRWWDGAARLGGLTPGTMEYFHEVGHLAQAARDRFLAANPTRPKPKRRRTVPADDSPRDYLTSEEAADRARFAVGTIYNAIYTGDLKKMEGSRHVRIKPAELDRWLSTRRPTRKEAQAAKRKQTDAAARKAAKKKSNGR